MITRIFFIIVVIYSIIKGMSEKLTLNNKTPDIMPAIQNDLILEKNVEEAKLLVYKGGLESYKTHYELLVKVATVLDSKAQTTITIAGIFIAAMFAFVRDLKTLELQHVEKYWLFATVILLILSILSSVIVFLLRPQTLPSGADMEEVISDLEKFNSDDVFFKERFNVLHQQMSVWKKPIISIKDSNNSKVKYLWSAQTLLLLAIISAGLLTVYIIFKTKGV